VTDIRVVTTYYTEVDENQITFERQVSLLSFDQPDDDMGGF